MEIHTRCTIFYEIYIINIKSLAMSHTCGHGESQDRNWTPLTEGMAIPKPNARAPQFIAVRDWFLPFRPQGATLHRCTLFYAGRGRHFCNWPSSCPLTIFIKPILSEGFQAPPPWETNRFQTKGSLESCAIKGAHFNCMLVVWGQECLRNGEWVWSQPAGQTLITSQGQALNGSCWQNKV